MKKYFLNVCTACALLVALTAGDGAWASILIDHTSTDLSKIPDQWISQIKSALHIAYQHTSHGSQLITGMNALQSYPPFGTTYRWTDDGTAGTLDLDDGGIEGCEDLSQGDSINIYGVTPWVTATRNLLNNTANSHINVVVWSWCSINGHNAQRYVDNMEKLVSEYPNVKFVFMTGHAEGQGEDTTANSVHYNNQLIRQHCAAHDRILFDFADIEAYDPDGDYFWDKNMYDNLDYTGGNWAVQWIMANSSSELAKLTTGAGVAGYSGCSGCAHSDSPVQANLNCVLKGRAAWWLWARLAGWSGTDNGTVPTTTTTTVKKFFCPAARALGEDNQQALAALREFRDTSIEPTMTGRLFIILYYMHAAELTALLEQDPELQTDARQVLENIVERIAACRYKARSLAPSEEELSRIDLLLERFEPLASLRLRMSIALVRNRLHSSDFLSLMNAE